MRLQASGENGGRGNQQEPERLQASAPMFDFSFGLSYSSCFRIAVKRSRLQASDGPAYPCLIAHVVFLVPHASGWQLREAMTLCPHAFAGQRTHVLFLTTMWSFSFPMFLGGG